MVGHLHTQTFLDLFYYFCFKPYLNSSNSEAILKQVASTPVSFITFNKLGIIAFSRVGVIKEFLTQTLLRSAPRGGESPNREYNVIPIHNSRSFCRKW